MHFSGNWSRNNPSKSLEASAAPTKDMTQNEQWSSELLLWHRKQIAWLVCQQKGHCTVWMSNVRLITGHSMRMVTEKRTAVFRGREPSHRSRLSICHSGLNRALPSKWRSSAVKLEQVPWPIDRSLNLSTPFNLEGRSQLRHNRPRSLLSKCKPRTLNFG